MRLHLQGCRHIGPKHADAVRFAQHIGLLHVYKERLSIGGLALCRELGHKAATLYLKGVVRLNSGRCGGCTIATALVTFLCNDRSSAGCACACIKLCSAATAVSAPACSREDN